MHHLRVSRLLTAALLAVVLWTGCDSTEEDRTDAERLLGTWKAVTIDTSGGVDLKSLIRTFQVQFTSSTTYRLSATGTDGVGLLNVAGTFDVDESAGVITFSSTSLTQPVSMSYQLDSGTALVLTFPSSALGELGVGLDPSVLNLIAGQEVTAIMQR